MKVSTVGTRAPRIRNSGKGQSQRIISRWTLIYNRCVPRKSRAVQMKSQHSHFHAVIRVTEETHFWKWEWDSALSTRTQSSSRNKYVVEQDKYINSKRFRPRMNLRLILFSQPPFFPRSGKAVIWIRLQSSYLPQGSSVSAYWSFYLTEDEDLNVVLLSIRS